MQPDCVMCEGTSECWIHSDFYRRIKANKSKLTDEQRTKFHNQVNELIDICGEVVVAGKKDLESYLSDEYVSKSEVDRLIREAKEELLDEMLEEANEVPHDEFYERALNWSSVKAFILSYYDRLPDESKHKEGSR